MFITPKGLIPPDPNRAPFFIPEPTQAHADLRFSAREAGCQSTNDYITWLEERVLQNIGNLEARVLEALARRKEPEPESDIEWAIRTR